MRPALLPSLGIAALCLAPVLARAGEATIAFRLEYSLAGGAERCPSEDVLHQELSRRLGYDPFAPDSGGVPAGAIRVVIAPAPPGLQATYEHVDAKGERRWTRTYSVPGTSTRACEGAVEGVAVDLAAEVALLSRKRPPPPPAPAPRPATPAPHAPEAAPHREGMPRPELEIGLGAHVASGVAPAVTVGGALHVGVAVFPLGRGRPWFSFGIEGRADKPAADEMRGVRTQLFAVSIVACGHKALAGGAAITWAVLGCVLGTAGKVNANVDELEGASLNGTYVSLGPRFGVEARLAGGVAIQALGDAVPTVHPVRIFTLGGREIWRTAGVSGGAGLAALFSF
jgi:hypothetical protein